MNITQVREYLLSKPGATENTPFNVPVPVFKVSDKMFALFNIHEANRESINLKYYKDSIFEIRDFFKEIQPGYHMNKANWNTIYLDGNLEDDFIKELIDISYNLVFQSLTKQKQREIID